MPSSYAVRTDVPALVASPSLVVAATLDGTLLRSLSEVTLGGELDVHVLYELPPNSTAVYAEFRRGFVPAQAVAAGGTRSSSRRSASTAAARRGCRSR